MSLKRLWTFEDYRQFLHHPDVLVRHWAAESLKGQYPCRQQEALVDLLDNPDDREYLWKTAFEALANDPDPSREEQVLNLLPACAEGVRGSAYQALGAMRSSAWRSELTRLLEKAPSKRENPAVVQELLGALAGARQGFADDEEVRQAVWHFAGRWEVDDDVLRQAVFLLLSSPSPDEIGRLLDLVLQKRYSVFFPPRVKSITALEAFAQRLFPFLSVYFQFFVGQLRDPQKDFLAEIAEFFESDLPFSYPLRARFEATYYSERAFIRATLKAAEEEMRHVASRRGDHLDEWLAEWQSGSLTDGYRWRAAYAYHLLRECRQRVAVAPPRMHEVAVVGFLALTHYLLDEDEEARLAAAPDETARMEVLADIFLSARLSVPDWIREELKASGAAGLKRLWELAEGGEYYPTYFARLRLLNLTIEIACLYPGSADDLVPVLLEWARKLDIDFGEGPYILQALRSIGPAAAPHLVRLVEEEADVDEEDSLALWGLEVLSSIPTELSLETLLNYMRSHMDIETAELYAIYLRHIPHPRALPVVRRLQEMVQQYRNELEEPESDKWIRGAEEELASVLCLIASIYDVPVPDHDRWRSLALQSFERLTRMLLEKDFYQVVPLEAD